MFALHTELATLANVLIIALTVGFLIRDVRRLARRSHRKVFKNVHPQA
jgi:hypothetical protein